MRRKSHIDHAQIVKRVAANVRAHRTKNGLSQYQLAHKSGLSLSYVSKVELGQVAVGIDTLDGLASALGVSAAELVGQTDLSESSAGLKDELIKKVHRFVERGDEASIRALAVLVGLADAELARRRN